MISVPNRYFRLCGAALITGGAMGAAGQAIHLEDTPASVADIPAFLPMAVNVHVLLAYASTLILLGLTGLFLRQAAGLRWWGWLALPLLFIGLMLEIFHGPVQILAYPILFGGIQDAASLQAVSDSINNLNVEQYPLQLAVLLPIVPFLLLGILLTALAVLKARVLSRGSALFALLVLIILILGFFIKLRFFELAFSYIHLSFIGYGIALFRSTASLTQPAAAAAGQSSTSA